MDVQVQRTFVIPSPPSEPEKVQFTVFDLLAPSYHYTALYAFSAPNPSNAALIEGLTAVLRYFPLLAARLDRNPVTDRPFFITGKGGAGALVVEATVPAALSDHLFFITDVAALVRKGIRAVDAAYFQSFIDFGALHGKEELEALSLGEDNELSPDVMVDSWMHLEMHRLDFGCGGRQAGILPTHVPGDGVVLLIPTFQEEGGVDAFVAIWDKHAEALKNLAYSTD